MVGAHQTKSGSARWRFPSAAANVPVVMGGERWSDGIRGKGGLSLQLAAPVRPRRIERVTWVVRARCVQREGLVPPPRPLVDGGETAGGDQGGKLTNGRGRD